jgi:hypothetical protein
METVSDSNLASELLQMSETYQAMRMKAIKDESAWDKSVDEANSARSEVIIMEKGWPTISLVGPEA